MSELINRGERRHVNVKDQDTWRLKEDSKGNEYATIVLKLNDYNEGESGYLFLNSISVSKLEELQAEIDRFLTRQRPKIERLREQAGEMFGDNEREEGE